MKNTLNAIDKDVNIDEVEEVRQLVKRYDIELKGNIKSKDKLIQYQTFYEELNVVITNKRILINNIEKKIKILDEFIPNENFYILLNKKKYNTNQLVDCVNRVVGRMKKIDKNCKLEKVDRCL